ncbi:uncharacterized protein [Amphiura filiformis]|uniref:uncharacterized protein isoform X2 n=1 Tax=Amphiura filiformis TaxID=82378 RepID=UPI003B20DEFB
MEFGHLCLLQFLVWNSVTWNFPTTAEVATAPLVDTSDGIWALSSRDVGIYLANRGVTEVNEWKAIPFVETDVTFDPLKGLLLYCIPADNAPYDCMLHKTSLDQCYNEFVVTISMEFVYGMQFDPDSRLLYVSAIDVPGICQVNIDTGQLQSFYGEQTNVNYLRISPDKSYLYWTNFMSTGTNHVRRGNTNGTGTAMTILSRPNAIRGFGIDFVDNRIYFTQDEVNIFSTDINGNDEQAITTDTARVFEMTVDNKYLYWGNRDNQFRRLDIRGDPASNTIETLTTVTNEEFINHQLITRNELDMSRSILFLSSSIYTANEADQSITIGVTRTGNLLRCSCVDVVVMQPGVRRLTRATIENTLNFAANDVTQSLTLTWTDDVEPNGPDQVSVNLIVNSDDIVGVVDEATVVIRDDDCGYYLLESDVTVNEDAGFVDVGIRRLCTGDMTGAFAETINVEAAEVDGSAQGGFDFVSGTIQASFAQGQDTANVRVPLFDNIQPEETERFVLRLSDPENGRLMEPNSAIVTITDYDNIYMIEQNQYEVMESNRYLDIAIQRIGNITLPGSVRLSARGQTAQFLSDFQIDPNSEIISFPSDISEITARILLTNDNILESNETFEVFLNSPMGGHLVERKEASITIIDDEVEVSMSDSRYSCLESQQCIVNVIRRGFLDQTTTANVRTEDFSAFAGIDFVAVDRILTFDPSVTSLDVQISLINDDVKEPHANFIVLVDDISRGLIGEPNRANVALWDDDSELPTLVYSLEQTSFSVKESDEELDIVVQRGGSYLGQVGSVRLQILPTSDGSSTGQDDFVATDIIVEFGEGQREQVIIISITNDDIIETTEEFVVQLSDAVNGVLGDKSRATGTIDDDDASYYLDKSLYNVNEISRELTLTVHRIGSLQQTGFVTLQVVSGNATYESDYIFSPIGTTLQFNPDQASKSTVIEIIDDFVAEQREIIDVILSRPKYGTLGNPSSAVIVIEDNDMVIAATLTPVPPSSRQIGTAGIALIIAGIVVLLIVTIISCAFCTFLLFRNPSSSWLFPKHQTPVHTYPSSPTYKVPPSPYADFGHVVRRFSGRVVRRLSDRLYKNPYVHSKQPASSQNSLVLYNTTNPMFEGDFFGLENYSKNRSFFDRPGVISNRITLPSVRDITTFKNA